MSEPDASPSENPWAIALALLALLALLTLVGGLLLVLIPDPDGGALARLLLGAAVVGVAGTLLAAWLFLAGIGWYRRQR